MQPLLEFRDVLFAYGSVPVLEQIRLHVHPGQFAALVGPSGAGKTTLLKLLLGTLRPQHGEIRIHGKVLEGQSSPQIAYVPQTGGVDWNFPVTVEQVVLMGRVRRSHIWPWPSRAEKAQMVEILSQLEIDHLAQRHIRDLSGGQQQRVFLARALIAQPDLLVLDEPTNGLDLRTAETILHLLVDLNQSGLTILMTSHDLNAVAAHLPWVICLNRRVIAEGRPEQVFTVPVLNETYQGDMIVIRQDGLLLVQQRPHGHTYHDLLPDPVLGHDKPVIHVDDLATAEDATEVPQTREDNDGLSIGTLSV
ncbi:MAG: metal ABC transporter ATP-binding protein [Caldilineaceae bacterium]|nr:metal ABC transporter ATP-binding protein [Caldilineaceae bacterium]